MRCQAALQPALLPLPCEPAAGRGQAVCVLRLRNADQVCSLLLVLLAWWGRQTLTIAAHSSGCATRSVILPILAAEPKESHLALQQQIVVFVSEAVRRAQARGCTGEGCCEWCWPGVEKADGAFWELVFKPDLTAGAWCRVEWSECGAAPCVLVCVKVPACLHCRHRRTAAARHCFQPGWHPPTQQHPRNKKLQIHADRQVSQLPLVGHHINVCQPRNTTRNGRLQHGRSHLWQQALVKWLWDDVGP